MTNPIPAPRRRANRANALRSTGPRTVAGIQRPSLNALTAASPMLPPKTPPPTSSTAASFSMIARPATPTRDPAHPGTGRHLLAPQPDPAPRSHSVLPRSQPPGRNPATGHARPLPARASPKGIPYDPTQDGFVFSKDQIETFAQRLMRRNTSSSCSSTCSRPAVTSPRPGFQTECTKNGWRPGKAQPLVREA